MEKRMGRGFWLRFFGLLKTMLAKNIVSVMFLFFFCVFNLYAQEGVERLNVVIQVTPASPVSGSTWTVTFLVDYPESQDVSVRPPYYPQGFYLERVRTSVRLYGPGATEDTDSDLEESNRWTAVEYLFSVMAAGDFTLGSFQISAGARQNNTAPIAVQVLAASQPQRQVSPSLRWERIPSVMTAGVAIELTLLLSNWDTAKPVPSNLFRGRIPENSILEELPFLGPGADRLIRYPVRIIPLEKGNFTLNTLIVQHEGERLEIPRIAVSVVEAGSIRPELHSGQSYFLSPESSIDEENALDNNAPFFPQNEKTVLRPFQREYEGIMTQATLLWESGQYARALALIRRNERDKIYGASLVPLRRNMEEELGLNFSTDETRSLVKNPLFLLIIAAILAVIAFQVTSRKLKGYSHIIRIVLGGACILFLLIVVAGYLRDTDSITVLAISQDSSSEKRLESGGSAILISTPVYRIPDSEGAVIFHFDEGQAVTIRSSPGAWIHVESSDGRSGWVPAESVIPY
ncbi:MAG: SH3 domain-containing protein [Treponema sp.]|jgi:hypothetical protein|nr:SH3 domain-containing protein [Treponema sp.]